MWFYCVVVGITCFPGSQNLADDYFKSINVKAAYQTNEPFILANQATQIFFWKKHLHVVMTREYCKGLSRGIRLMKLYNKMTNLKIWTNWVDMCSIIVLRFYLISSKC